MREMDFSQFRKNCSRILRELQNTAEKLRITRHGEALVVIVPMLSSTKLSEDLAPNGSGGTGQKSEAD
jgi:antitoxin (DNA-binding transcriptional repressor) of toxin-antitoxin stability system